MDNTILASFSSSFSSLDLRGLAMGEFDHVKLMKIEQKYLLSELGLAICMWSLVEDYLCDVLVATIDATNKTPFVESYYAVPSVENKIRMTNAALGVAAKGRKTLLSKWGTLLNRLNRKRKLRNELAHCQVIGQYHPRTEVFLVPYGNLHHYQRIPGLSGVPSPEPEYALKRLFSKDVRQRQDSFYTLARQLDEFAQMVAEKLGTTPKVPPPKAKPRGGSQPLKRPSSTDS